MNEVERLNESLGEEELDSLDEGLERFKEKSLGGDAPGAAKALTKILKKLEKDVAKALDKAGGAMAPAVRQEFKADLEVMVRKIKMPQMGRVVMDKDGKVIGIE